MQGDGAQIRTTYEHGVGSGTDHSETTEAGIWDREPKTYEGQQNHYNETDGLDERWALWTEQTEQWIYQTFMEPKSGNSLKQPKLQGQLPTCTQRTVSSPQSVQGEAINQEDRQRARARALVFRIHVCKIQIGSFCSK